MTSKPTIVVYGNCAAQFLAHELRRLPAVSDNFEIHWIRSFFVPPGYYVEEPLDPTALPRCRFFLEQVGNFRDDLLRRGSPLNEIPIPPGCRRIRFPPLFLNTLWPFVARDPRNEVCMKPWCNEGPYPGHISNRLILEIMREEKDPDRVYERFMNTKIKDRVDLDRLHKLTMTKIRALDRESDVTVADFIDGSMASTRLFLVQIHPAGPTLRRLYEEILRCLDIEAPSERLLEIEASRGIGGYDAPIHPEIVEHFGLSWARGLKYRHYAEGSFTYEEFIRRNIRFEWTMLFYLGVHLARDDSRLVEAEALLNQATLKPNASSQFFVELGKVRERLGWKDQARRAYLRAAHARQSE